MSGKARSGSTFRWAPVRTAAAGMVPRAGGGPDESPAVKRPPRPTIPSEPVTHPLSVHGIDAVITLTPDPTENAVHWAVLWPAEATTTRS